MHTVGGVVTQLWTVRSCHDRMGLQRSKAHASSEGCGVGGPYATVPPTTWLGNEHCPELGSERRYSWCGGDRHDGGCRLARIRR